MIAQWPEIPHRISKCPNIGTISSTSQAYNPKVPYFQTLSALYSQNLLYLSFLCSLLLSSHATFLLSACSFSFLWSLKTVLQRFENVCTMVNTKNCFILMYSIQKLALVLGVSPFPPELSMMLTSFFQICPVSWWQPESTTKKRRAKKVKTLYILKYLKSK